MNDSSRTLKIRVTRTERCLIDRAAKARGKNRTDFIRDAALTAAEVALFGRTSIPGHTQAYAAFLARLDMPPAPNSHLRKTMQTPPPWE